MIFLWYCKFVQMSRCVVGLNVLRCNSDIASALVVALFSVCDISVIILLSKNNGFFAEVF